MTYPIVLGVSACLLGECVRYDGGYRHDFYITDTLGKYFSFVPVCPEVGCGLPVPREAMQLEGDPVSPRLMTLHTRIDKTVQLLAFCSDKINELKNMDLSGFIFKERSPSCGLSAVPLYGSGNSEMFTVGLFANEVARCFPLMPLEESEQLNNQRLREDFIDRILVYHGMKND